MGQFKFKLSQFGLCCPINFKHKIVYPKDLSFFLQHHQQGWLVINIIFLCLKSMYELRNLSYFKPLTYFTFNKIRNFLTELTILWNSCPPSVIRMTKWMKNTRNRDVWHKFVEKTKTYKRLQSYRRKKKKNFINHNMCLNPLSTWFKSW